MTMYQSDSISFEDYLRKTKKKKKKKRSRLFDGARVLGKMLLQSLGNFSDDRSELIFDAYQSQQRSYIFTLKWRVLEDTSRAGFRFSYVDRMMNHRNCLGLVYFYSSFRVKLLTNQVYVTWGWIGESCRYRLSPEVGLSKVGGVMYWGAKGKWREIWEIALAAVTPAQYWQPEQMSYWQLV